MIGREVENALIDGGFPVVRTDHWISFRLNTGEECYNASITKDGFYDRCRTLDLFQRRGYCDILETSHEFDWSEKETA